MTTLDASRTLGVYELKAHLSSVLEEVMAGAIVTVTRHGHPVARITPITAGTERERRAAVERIKSTRRGVTLGIPVKDAIEEGRR